MVVADKIITELVGLGVELSVEDDVIELTPGSRVPDRLATMVKIHKADIIDRLNVSTPSDEELVEIEEQVQANGYVLLWSTVLRDMVAFCREDKDRRSVPVGFVIYTVDELATLFGNHARSPRSLRLIHAAKKYTRGNIIDA